MATGTAARGRPAGGSGGPPAAGARPAGGAALAWVLARRTVATCLRYRVTGLAAEAGFFALLSLPPLVLGLVASAGFLGSRLGTPTLEDLRGRIQSVAETFLTPQAVQDVLLPTFVDVATVARPGVAGVGVLLALWSGSRALNVFIDTISIMYGLGGHRGIVRSRVLSFGLYLLALVAGAVVIPLVLIGPRLLAALLPESVAFLGTLYWPVVSVGTVAGLTTLYHVSTPVRSAWSRDLPGAVLALGLWLLTSLALRWVIGAAVGGTSIYGPLAMPIVVLIWLYFLAIAVLIGAALNSAVDATWPDAERERARRRPPAAPHPPLTPVPPEAQADLPGESAGRPAAAASGGPPASRGGGSGRVLDLREGGSAAASDDGRAGTAAGSAR
jgi:membrane protein